MKGKTLAKDAAEINDTPYCTTFSYWQKRISTTLQRYNAKALQQSQYKIARVTAGHHDTKRSERLPGMQCTIFTVSNERLHI